MTPNNNNNNNNANNNIDSNNINAYMFYIQGVQYIYVILEGN